MGDTLVERANDRTDPAEKGSRELTEVDYDGFMAQLRTFSESQLGSVNDTDAEG